MSNTYNGSGFDAKVESMKRIVSTFMHQQSVKLEDCELKNISSNSYSFQKNFTVANLWDVYLARIAKDARLNPGKFAELVGILPCSTRSSHDLLYKAIHTYLKTRNSMMYGESPEITLNPQSCLAERLCFMFTLDFMFSLLHKSIGCNLSSEYKTLLEARIASQLENATIDYFLLPMSNTYNGSGFDAEVESMKRIVSTFMHQQSVKLEDCELKNISNNSYSFQKIFNVANLSDVYLGRIAKDARLNPGKFAELVGISPCSTRSCSTGAFDCSYHEKSLQSQGD